MKPLNEKGLFLKTIRLGTFVAWIPNVNNELSSFFEVIVK